MGKGQDLYKKAKQMIPGGTMLYQRDLNNCCLRTGLHISVNQRDVKYGILTVIIIMTVS